MRALSLFTLSLFLFFLTNCEKEAAAPTYEIPNTYDFENVSYTGQQDRLAMLLEMKNYMATSRTGGALDADRLKAMYRNDAANAGFSRSYTKDIKSKTFEAEQDVFDDLIDELAAASTSAVAGREGQSGVIQSLDGQKSYLVGEDGLDHAQLIEKGLMGACFYYQATAVYMGEDRMNVDNETVEPGLGTDMEHHWDEAFGYFGAPKDFPINTAGLFFWADYSNKRNAMLNSNEPLMQALIKGRAAITNKDLATRDEAIAEAREWWEKVSVATALHYLNVSINQFDDMSILSHALSEGIGFVYALQFNPDKRINNSQARELLTLMGGAPTFDQMNLYQVNKADLETARSMLAGYYDMVEDADKF